MYAEIIKNFDIKITPDNEWEQAVIWYMLENRHLINEPWEALEDFFLDSIYNGVFWRIDPTVNGDLTSGLIFTNGIYEWWDASYAIRAWIDDVANEGKAFVRFARSHNHPVTLQEAKELLLSTGFTVALFSNKPYYTFKLVDFNQDLFTKEDFDFPEIFNKYLADLSSIGLTYRRHDKAILDTIPYVEFADTDIEAPWDVTVEMPKCIIDTWPEAKIMETAKLLWNRHNDLRAVVADWQDIDDYSYSESIFINRPVVCMKAESLC